MLLIVTDGRAASRETADAALLSGKARWIEAGRVTADWRQALLRAEMPAAVASLTPAALAARSVGAGEHGSWLAAAVHLQAGLDRVHLPAHGLLRLADAEMQQFTAAFNDELGDPSLQMLSLPGGIAVLSGLDAPDALTRDPATVLGDDVREAVPRGVETARLRALSGEIEMWLHEHPLNRARQRRGEWPVSSFWLWGGDSARVSTSASVAAPAGKVAFGGNDPWLRAVARVLDPSRDTPAADFSQWLAAGVSRGIVAVSAAGNLAPIHAAWLEPARAALAARRITRLTLWVNGRILTLSPSSSWHYWRPARHWLEFLQ